MIAIIEILNDRALPVLAAIRACGLAVVLPALELDGCPVELTLRGYSEGSRVALEVRAGQRHFAVKAYEDDPSPEVELYGVLAANGFTDDAPVRVPPLLGWNCDLHVLAIGWLDGPTAHELIECGQGRRAGELAARWLQRAATLPVKLGRPFGASRMLHRGRKWAAALGEADPALGGAATALVEMLARTQPKQE